MGLSEFIFLSVQKHKKKKVQIGVSKQDQNTVLCTALKKKLRQEENKNKKNVFDVISLVFFHKGEIY